MPYKFSKAEVWAGDILNRPGTLARVLEALANSGAQLEFMIARRVSEATSRVFFAPLKAAKQKKAALELGLVPAQGLHVLRIEGQDRPGLGAALTRAVADHGLNLRGASAAAVSKKTAFYLAFEKEEDLKAAMKIARKALASKRK